MDTTAIPSELKAGLWQRLVEEFPASAEEWSRSVSRLNDWEDSHLLTEAPSAKDLARHLHILERLMFFGQLCALVATHPELGDADTAAMVLATQEVLRNKLLMFHHPMPRAEADRILKEVFPES